MASCSLCKSERIAYPVPPPRSRHPRPSSTIEPSAEPTPNVSPSRSFARALLDSQGVDYSTPSRGRYDVRPLISIEKSERNMVGDAPRPEQGSRPYCGVYKRPGTVTWYAHVFRKPLRSMDVSGDFARAYDAGVAVAHAMIDIARGEAPQLATVKSLSGPSVFEGCVAHHLPSALCPSEAQHRNLAGVRSSGGEVAETATCATLLPGGRRRQRRFPSPQVSPNCLPMTHLQLRSTRRRLGAGHQLRRRRRHPQRSADRAGLCVCRRPPTGCGRKRGRRSRWRWVWAMSRRRHGAKRKSHQFLPTGGFPL